MYTIKHCTYYHESQIENYWLLRSKDLSLLFIKLKTNSYLLYLSEHIVILNKQKYLSCLDAFTSAATLKSLNMEAL